MEKTSPSFAGVVNLFRLGVENGTDALAADADHALVLVRGLHHGETIFYRMRHGLFAVDVFAGGDGVFEDVPMLVIHGRDQDGVDIFAIEDRAIVAGRWNAGIFDGFLRGDVAAVIEVANGDALNARNAEGGFEMLASADAGADGSETNGVAGRYRAPGGEKFVRLKKDFRGGGGGQGSGADMHELTTIQGMDSHEFAGPHSAADFPSTACAPA